ncbi:MAG: hypothetical protein M3140_00245 [Actinomycetota bacterium]|nr:hypothetical protein [Actinomycetota bacterium]
MDGHGSLREYLASLADQGAEPEFEVAADPVLAKFATIFADSGLYALDANRFHRTGSLSDLYDCTTVRRRGAGDEPEIFSCRWAPVWASADPLTGFRTGPDSAWLGSTPTRAMPPDERTSALLLLVTSPYLHLSASREQSPALIRGAFEAGGGGLRYTELDPAVLTHDGADAGADDGADDGPARLVARD